jgi:hypothetical protein
MIIVVSVARLYLMPTVNIQYLYAVTFFMDYVGQIILRTRQIKYVNLLKTSPLYTHARLYYYGKLDQNVQCAECHAVPLINLLFIWQISRKNTDYLWESRHMITSKLHSADTGEGRACLNHNPLKLGSVMKSLPRVRATRRIFIARFRKWSQVLSIGKVSSSRNNFFHHIITAAGDSRSRSMLAALTSRSNPKLTTLEVKPSGGSFYVILRVECLSEIGGVQGL